MIYIVRSGDAIKVGKANRIDLRLESLQCGNPVKLKLLAAFPGDHELEARFHRWLAPDRIHGEWFEGPLVPQALEFALELSAKLRAVGPSAKQQPEWRGLMTWPRSALSPRGRARPRTPAPVTVRRTDPSSLSR